jgi:hypothetical protein
VPISCIARKTQKGVIEDWISASPCDLAINIGTDRDILAGVSVISHMDQMLTYESRSERGRSSERASKRTGKTHKVSKSL